ncbi:MAG: hypothetical protein AM325_009860 [Candidatus Thorarchaeota archaeon SMTZ1-45]
MMRKSCLFSLIFVALFVFSLADLSGSGVPTVDRGLLVNSQYQVSEAGGAYVGTGSPLTVSFSGTFTNSSSWSQTTTTLSSSFTSGTSFVVTNSSTVAWTAYILVSPPAEVESLSFNVDYQETEWRPISLTNPIGVVMSYPTEWWYETGLVFVSQSAVTTHGLWKLEFVAMNHLFNLELGPSSGPLGSTSTFGLSDEMLFRSTSSWITGASTKFVLTDPTGSEWYFATNTTSGSPTHILQSFRYKKDITIDRTRHLATSVNNFPVLIDITDSDLQTDVQNDGDDILFVSGGHILSHQIELFEKATGHLVAWVKTNLTGSVNTVVSMYYGNPLLGNMENPADVWTESFAAVWHLDEDATAGQTTATHYDSTSEGYDGTQNGNFDDSGRVGLGQHFDGSNDQIVILASEVLEPAGDVEISGWFKLDVAHTSTSTTTKLLFTKMLDGDNDMHIALVGTDYTTAAATDGSLVFKTENGGNGQMYKWTSQTSWQAGVWYYFSCFMDASTPSNNRIQVNGVVDVAGSSGGITYADLSFTADWGIGGGLIDQISGNLAWFDGVMDEVRVSATTTANGRSTAWRAAEYQNLNSPSTFYSIGPEQERTSPDSQIKKTVDVTALAGSWVVSGYYNDSGSSVNYRVGMYERTFVIKHASSLSLTAPTDAVADSITVATIGDSVYVQVELTDGITASGVAGSIMTTNWTIYGSGTNLQFHDEGGGLYGLVLNTSHLENNIRWRLNILSSHPYYTDASTTLYIDLNHDTSLDYTNITSTPTGFDFTATLFFTDTFNNGRISGATITLANGTVISPDAEGNGQYNISIPTSSLTPGIYWYIINATKPGSLYEMASVNITFILRPHYTAASVSGDLLTPWGFDTPLTVVLIDLDTGGFVDISNVDSITLTPSGYGPQVFGTYSLTLDTDLWTVGVADVTLTISMSSSNYYEPDAYVFQITIRKHYTSATVVGNLVTPYGNNTPLTVMITDLDTGAAVSASSVDYLEFDSSYPLFFLNSPFTTLAVTLPTGDDSWAVGVESVTLSINMIGSSVYQDPSDYLFQLTIRSMTTYLYNEPSDLIFPNGDDFTIVLYLNVSEIGPNYGNPINGLAADFTVKNSTYTYPAVVIGLGNGRYNLTIAASFFPEGTYTITVTVNPSDSRYAKTQLVITFDYRPARSDLTANLYTVSTPYDHDITIVLFYEDLDRGVGITTGDITSLDATIFDTHTGGGYYDVLIDVSGLAVGTHVVNLEANAAGYDARSVTITIIITKIHTDAEPSLVSLDMPVGSTKIFYIDFNDLDNGVPINVATPTNNWSTPANVVVTWTGITWEVSFTTTGSDALGTYIVWFNFDEGSGNYYDGFCEIEVVVRSHVTIFNLVSAIEPTPYNGIVNISLRYYDWDGKVGITDDSNILSRVWNQTNWITHTLVNDGSGYYTIQINATLFGQGVQNFIIYFDWIGPVQQFENKSTNASGNIIGIDSRLTLLQSSEPTPYLGSMLYIFNYAETGGAGITNTSYGGGNVHIYVNFQGQIVDLGQITITEIDPVLQPGNYSISFSTTIFGRTGLIYMNVYINWTAGVAPFYTNRFDVISVRILPRDTVLSVVPPTPQAYGENATFSFTFEDVTGGASVPIDDDPALDVSLSLSDYTLTWNGGTHEFTISFNTSQFGAPLGQKSFTLSVTWAGAPYYNNRTGRTVFVMVTTRQTVFDYQSPAPTAYLNNVTINLEWTDVSGAATRGIEGAMVTLFNAIFPIPSVYYTVRDLGNGMYEVELNTTAYSNPADYELTIEMSTSYFYLNNVSSMRILKVLYRSSLLSAEPIGPAPYNSSLVYILDFQDRLTLDTIGNDTLKVTLTILNGSSWYFNIEWKPAFQYYELTIETYNHPELVIGLEYTLRIQASYANQAPFYGSDDTYVFFELRTRSSIVTLVESPDPTPYLEDAQFRVRYVDSDSGKGILASSISLYKSGIPLTEGVHYVLTNQGNGYYLFTLETTALDGLAYTTVQVRAIWSGGAPYHDNANLNVDVYVTRREANVEIITPPTQARYLDNVTFQFVYRDLGSGVVITTITSSEIEVWAAGILLALGQYMITGIAGTFTVEVNSTVLSPGLVTSYNITIRVDWDDGSAPYYFDDSTIVRVSTRSRLMSYTVLSAEETAFGELLNLSFTLLDADSSNPVIDALISFDLKTGGLVEGVDFIVIKGIGIYTIQIDTTALGVPGTYLFDLDVGWNGSSPYYLGLPTITMTGIVSKIDTLFVPLADLVTGQWQSSASITLNYTSLLDGSPVLGAEMKWIWNEAFIYAGPAGEIGSGLYQADIDTSLADAGTYVITFIIENLTAYKEAVAYVTLVITNLDSQLTLIDPALPVISVNRGAALIITVYFIDGTSNPISHSIDTQVVATIEGVSFPLTYNGTPGYYTVTLPENDETATKRAPRTPYNVIISATTKNYDPALSSVTFYVLQSATEIQLGLNMAEEMTFVYSEMGLLTVNVVIDAGDIPFWNGTVQWSIQDLGLIDNFTIDYGNGTFSTYLDTTTIGYGIVPIMLRFIPWNNMSLYATSLKLITVAITRIQTSVTPPSGREFYWGWSGYLEFIYWSESFGTGIPDADVTLTLPGLESSVAIDLNNGTYLVFLNTTLLRGSSSYLPLTVSFTKANHLEANAIIQIRILEVPTEISVESVEYTPSYAGTLEDLINLQIPIGDSMAIDFWYNDTDNSEGFVGGLFGATSTPNSYLRGPTIDGYLNVTVITLGGGLYRVVFDTMDAIIAAQASSEEYRLYIEMTLSNRSTTDILFKIGVINIPAELIIIGTPPTIITNGEIITLELFYHDIWHNLGISSATSTANVSAGSPFSAQIEAGSAAGQYFLSLNTRGLMLSPGSGTVTINLNAESYSLGSALLFIEVLQNNVDVLVTNGITFGLPIVLIIAILGFAYMRVWSVPKQLRMINNQIKIIKKGKIPKPVKEVRSRQKIIADLYTDTYEKLGMTRPVDAFPEESIPVEVPELGGLLIQLSILTNLNQQELDDFKADIAKMKMSEQAAFVKEVIMQEAIRAARREGITVEETIERIQKEASQRLAGEEGRRTPEDTLDEEPEELEEEPVFLAPRKKEPDVELDVEPDEPDVPTEDFSFSSDQMSPFEIEELRKELLEKGVPLAEIDIIIKQAGELPRELIEELVRSLDVEKSRKGKKI